MTSVVRGDCDVVEEVVDDIGLRVFLVRAKAFQEPRDDFTVNIFAILPTKTMVQSPKAV
jgi:hypothetical protein